MNRKDRRAAAKRGSAAGFSENPGFSETALLFAQAIRHHQAGELREAERLYGEVLARDPNHAKSLNLLGLAAHQSGRNDAAAALIGKALAIDEANAESHYNLAVVFAALGRPADAITQYQRAIALRPDYAEAIMNLGNARMAQGRGDEALVCYERVLALAPGSAAAHYNIANISAQRGDLDVAAARYRQAIAIDPGIAEAYNNLGNIAKELGRSEEAIAHYQRALALRPDHVTFHDNLARMLMSVGKMAEAFDLLRRALALGSADDTKILIVRCLQNLNPTADDPELRAIMLRAFSECWVSGNELAPAAGLFLKQTEHIRAGIEKVGRAWPERLSFDTLLGPAGLSTLAGDRLLCCLLENAPLFHIELERFATAIRFALLGAEVDGHPALSTPDGLRLCCAMAQQCFINEYVFALTPAETESVARLRQAVTLALASGGTVSLSRLAALAAYVPLHAVDGIDALVDSDSAKDWPSTFDAVVTRQLREPRRERQLGMSIPVLTAIDDAVSVAVRRQYEENPYPRWVMAPIPGAPVRLEDDLRAKLPHARIQRLSAERTIDVLVAGCGTGRHTVETAQRFANTRILCVDLSLASLAYATRKTRELGLANIDYAQADILKLGSIGRSFDVIESNGVLHHLADPMSGWRVLVELLRPGGLMNIGVYSATARRNVSAARAYIAEKGYGSSVEDIRACRQDLMAHDENTLLGSITRAGDFFSTSSCRDLLFHVQEHQLTIPQINEFLAAHGLRFLGFELDIRMLHRFGLKFPDPLAVTELDRWHAFEQDNPGTFAAMYQFWVQKDA